MKNISVVRRNNVMSLVYHYGSQTKLAATLASNILTQQILSAIMKGKRALQPHEAREIETTLVIPNGWMDKQDSIEVIRGSYGLITKYRLLSKNDRDLFNDMAAFVEKTESL
jgi:hypothetical protein